MVRVLVAIVLLSAATARAGSDDDLAAVTSAAPGCSVERAHCIGIALHVAATDTGLVAAPDWIATQLAAANRHFAPLDVGYALASVDALPAAAAHVATRGDRDALAAHRLGGKTIHVFIVGQLDDVDEAGQIAYGVTWHAHGTYLIVSAQALERTLAHELGHFFGLPHSSYPISIMNKSDRKEPPMEERTFAPEEIDAMRPVLRRLLRDQVIADIKAPRT